MRLKAALQSAARLPIIKLILITALGSFLYLTSELDKPDWFIGLDEEETFGLFNLLRFVIFTGFALLAYRDFRRPDKTLAILWTASALLINPVVQVKLGKTIWQVCDWTWIILIAITLVIELPKSVIGVASWKTLTSPKNVGLGFRRRAKMVYDISQRHQAPHEWAWDKSDTDTVIGCAVWFVIIATISIVAALFKWLTG